MNPLSLECKPSRLALIPLSIRVTGGKPARLFSRALLHPYSQHKTLSCLYLGYRHPRHTGSTRSLSTSEMSVSGHSDISPSHLLPYLHRFSEMLGLREDKERKLQKASPRRQNPDIKCFKRQEKLSITLEMSMSDCFSFWKRPSPPTSVGIPQHTLYPTSL